jgi:TetR/AcrR family tetracycline transcriptional repressor
MKPGPRRSIKQSDIVAAAFEILEQSGFAAVSIRGVAGALGLTPTAMYTYFPSKQDLLRAMVEELFAGVLADAGATAGGSRADAPGEADGSGEADPARATLLAAAVDLRERLRAHPGAVSLVTVSGVAGVGTIALVERLGQAFAAAGLPTDDAARAAHALLAHTIGQVALEQAWGDPSAEVAESTLWTDEPSRPIADAGDRLGLRAGDAPEFSASVDRLLTAWLP